MKNPFDQFDAPAPAAQPDRNPFDQFDDTGFFEGTWNSAQRGYHSALQSMDVAQALAAETRRQTADEGLDIIAKRRAMIPEPRREDFEKYGEYADGNYQRALENYRHTMARYDSEARAEAGLKKKLESVAPEAIADIARRQKKIDALPQSKGKREYDEAEGIGGALGALARHPLDVVAGVSAESLPASSPSLALGALGSIAGPVGTAAGAGAGSFAAEAASTILQELQDMPGVDFDKPETVIAALQDQEKMDALKAKAFKRGVPVAAFDALSAGIAGRLFGKPAKTILGKAAHGAAEMGAQGAMGGAGEAAGGLVAEGKVDPKAVLSEILGEMGSGAGEVATGTVRDKAMGTRRTASDTGRNVPDPSPIASEADKRAYAAEKAAVFDPYGTASSDTPLPVESGPLGPQPGAPAPQQGPRILRMADGSFTVTDANGRNLGTNLTAEAAEALRQQAGAAGRTPVQAQIEHAVTGNPSPGVAVDPEARRAQIEQAFDGPEWWPGGQPREQVLAERRAAADPAGALREQLGSEEAAFADPAGYAAWWEEQLAGDERLRQSRAGANSATFMIKQMARDTLMEHGPPESAEFSRRLTPNDKSGNAPPHHGLQQDNRPDSFTGFRTDITGSRVSAAQALRLAARGREIALRPPQPDAGGTQGVDTAQPPRIGGFGPDSTIRGATGRELKQFAEGAEARVYIDRPNGVVYKAYTKGNSGSIGLKIGFDSKGLAMRDTGSLSDLYEKVWVINALGGAPTEIAGRLDTGEIVTKQPLGSLDATWQPWAVNREARLVEIPDTVLKRPQGLSELYLSHIDGHDIIVGDLHEGNYIGDTLARGRIADLVTHRITPADLDRFPQLRVWLDQNRAAAQAPGPRDFARRTKEQAAAERANLVRLQDAWRKNAERIAPGLMRKFRLEFGAPADLARKGRAAARDLTGYEEAAYLAHEKMLYLFDEALQSNPEGVTLTNLLHEMGHAHWDTLSQQRQAQLLDLWQAETEARKGPLYVRGKLKQGVALGVEGNVKEWYAERIAAENHDWARRKAGAAYSIRGLAGQMAQHFRSLLSRLRDYARQLRGNTINVDFRSFLNQGDRFAEQPAPAVVRPGDAQRPADPDTAAFKQWFGKSKVVDGGGRPLVVYHQTSRENENAIFSGRGFSTDSKLARARLSDDQVPNGIFFKPNAKNIGVGSANRNDTVQMPVYLAVQNPLRAADRADFVRKIAALSPEYAEKLRMSNERDAHFQRRFVEAEKQEAGRTENDPASEERLNALELMLNEWRADERTRAAELRSAIDLILADHGYDGVILDSDTGSLGRKTQTFIALRPEQIKSATRNNGAFDPNDPRIDFARRRPPLIGGARDASKAAAAWLRRWMTSAGGMPEAAFKAKVVKDGRIAAIAKHAQFAIRDLDRAVRSVYGGYGSMTNEQMKQINDVLGGAQPLETLDARLRAPVAEMRSDIDVLSRRLVRDGAISGELAAKVSGNIGFYLHRSYRKFDDPKWAKNVPPEVLNRAESFIAAELAAKNPGQPVDPKEVRGLVDYMLGKDVAEAGEFFSRPAREGAKDLSIFTKRKDIAPEIRELMGENFDPRINYLRSVAKTAQVIESHDFLKQVRAAGIGKWLFEKPVSDGTREGSFTTLIAPEGSKAMEPLNGLYTTADIAKAFHNTLNPVGEHTWRWWRWLNGMAKTAKTVHSPMTQSRNVLGNGLFLVANGHWRADAAAEVLTALRAEFGRGDTAKAREYLTKLTRLGIVGESVNAGELREAISDAGVRMGDIQPLIDGRLKRAAKAPARLAARIYQLNDEIFKIYAFENERRAWAKADPSLSPAQVDAIAAERVRNTMPTYSLIPRFMQGWRRLSITGSFLSFPSEVARVTYRTIRYMQQDLASSNPRIHLMGAKRLAGLIAVATVPKAVSMLTRWLAGMDKDDEKDLRRFLPEWSRNADIYFQGSDGKGRYRLIDASYLDPWNYFKKPLTAFLNADNVWDGVKAAVKEALEPYAGEGLVTKLLLDLARNRDDEGRPIANREDDFSERAKAYGKHAWRTFEPGFIAQGRRIHMAATGRVENSGRAYDLPGELQAVLTGARSQSVDVGQALISKARRFASDKREIENIYTEVRDRKGNVTTLEKGEAQARMEKLRRRRYEAFAADIAAAQRLGVSKPMVMLALKGGGVGDVDVVLLLKNNYLPYISFPFSRMEVLRGLVEER